MLVLDSLPRRTYTPDHTFFDDLVAMLLSVSNNMRALGILGLIDALPAHVRTLCLTWGGFAQALNRMSAQDAAAAVSTAHQALLYSGYPDFPLVIKSNRPANSMMWFPNRMVVDVAQNGWPRAVDMYIVTPDEIAGLNAQADSITEYTETRIDQTTNGIIAAFLVRYYESQRDEMEQRFGRVSDALETWPEPLRFAWAIRNSFAHGGIRIDDSKRRPFTWGGFAYSQQDNRLDVLAASDGLRLADIVLLFEAMHLAIHS